MSAAKNWTFTINNWTQEDLGLLELFREAHCKYMIYEFERGEQGTAHIQGYLQLKTKDRMSGNITKWGKNNVHWEIARASPEENIAYCSKEHTECIWGEPEVGANRGARTDLKKLIADNATLKSLKDAAPETFCRYRNGLIDLYNDKRTDQPRQEFEVHWLAGPTGCGKTRLAFGDGEDVWMSSVLPWFDGYIGQKKAILDDYRSGDMPFNRFLRLLDRYPLQCPIKGGFTTWNPKEIWITCPRTPAEEFVRHSHDQQGNAQTEQFEDVNQVIRRCTTIRKWNEDLQVWLNCK